MTKPNCRIIMSMWNGGVLSSTLHTWFVQKTGMNTYYTYNDDYGIDSVYKSSISETRQPGNFIVGYII